MERQDIIKKLTTILVEQLGIEPEQVTMESRFEELGADSLDCVELVMAVEEEFATDIPDDEAEKIQTVSQAVEWLEKNA